MNPHPLAAGLAAILLAPWLSTQEPGLTLPESSPRVADYTLRVELDARARTVGGEQRIRWRNTTSGATDELRFHLYLNAFSGPRSTFMREAGADFRDPWRPGDHGGTEVSAVRLVTEGGPVPLETAFLRPDDDNPDDRTVLQVRLPEPVAPGAEVVVAMDFESRMPKALRRTGWVPGGGFYCMHWYPILGVLEDDGEGGVRWNCHQFHANSEFYADFARYDVSITVPEGYVVGATGVEQGEPERAGGRETVRFVQEDVHNFAFVADPDFVRVVDHFGPFVAAQDPTGVAPRVAEALGVPVSSFDLPRTEIVLLLHPYHDTEAQRRRHLEAIKVGLEFFGLRYGPYPYPRVTAVDPGRDVQGRSLGGGMEYPTLFTCGTPLFLHERQRRPEGVTVHEFGHQYWYGLAANNEFEEAWLDEGINTYSEGRAQWLGYAAGALKHGGPPKSVTTGVGLATLAAAPSAFLPEDGGLTLRRVPGLDGLPATVRERMDALRFEGRLIPDSPLLRMLRSQPLAAWTTDIDFADVWEDRRRWLSVDNPEPMVQPGWEYLSRDTYVANSYHRPATLLRTLERMVGKEPWWAFLREFHARARFAHPTTGDFTALLEQRCGAGVADFFREAIVAGAHLDYGVHRVRDPEGPHKEVVIRRHGTLTAEVDVRFRFAERDEPVVRTIAAGDRGRLHRFTFGEELDGGPLGALEEVWVDPPLPADPAASGFARGEENVGPAGRYLIDENVLNNAWQREADRLPARTRALRVLLQVQTELSFFGLIG